MRIFSQFCAILLLSFGVFGILGCSQVLIRESLESAEEKTIVRWEPNPGSDLRVEGDLGEGLESGRMDIRVLQEESPVYQVKNAVVTRETTTCTLRLPEFLPGDAFLWPVTLPTALVVYGGMAIIGFPESCYLSTTKVETAEGSRAEVHGRETRWAPAPGVLLRCRINGREAFTIRSDSEGTVGVDLVAIAREYPCPPDGLTISFRVKKDGWALERIEIGPRDVEDLRHFPK